MVAAVASGAEKGEARRSLRLPPLPLLAAAFAILSLAADWSAVRSVLHGEFSDPDDAMRLVEVRAWLAGQPWFDVDAMRLDPPAGASMHWSRLVDLPNAALIRLFGLFADASMAEKLDRVVLPTLLLAGLYWCVGRLAAALLGRRAVLPALAATFFSGSTLVLFSPGRIGHHAPDTLALVGAVGALLGSLEPGRERRAALAGALVALSLGMSLETLPYLAVLCAGPVGAWVVLGRPLLPLLRWFALGLGGAMPPVFLATVAPAHWLRPAADALSAGQAGAALVGAAGCLCLAAAGPYLRSRGARAMAAAALGAAVLAFLALLCPVCLRGPFAGIDPLVRAAWLDQVVESLPLPAFTQRFPALGVAISLPVLLGAVGALVTAVRSSGRTRLRFALVAALAATGFALGFWQVRGFTSIAPVALCGGLPAAFALERLLARRGVRGAAVLGSLALVPFASSLLLALLPSPAPAGDAPSCLGAEAFAPIARLPPGRVVAPINEGSHLLVATPHSVFAGPYHRDNDGNRYVLDVFGAAPDEARRLLASRDVAYLMICPGSREAARLADRSPDALAARLARGAVPAFLRPLALPHTPWKVFAVEAGGGSAPATAP